MENQRTQASNNVKLGRFLSLVLRHNPNAAGISLDEHGWVDVQELKHCGPMKLGRRYGTDVLDIDPFTEINPYPSPVLIVHGTGNSIVHPDYSQHAFEAYSKRCGSGASVYLEMIEGGAHGFSNKYDVLVLEKLDGFLKE